MPKWGSTILSNPRNLTRQTRRLWTKSVKAAEKSEVLLRLLRLLWQDGALAQPNPGPGLVQDIDGLHAAESPAAPRRTRLEVM